jgi:hypothetical protein
MKAKTIKTTSEALQITAKRALSYLSASSPAVAEKRKYGRINTPAATEAKNAAFP